MVPQFIDVEDKILGPITVRQFIVSTISSILIFVAYRFADFGLFLIEAMLIVLIAGALAFLRINGQAFHDFLLNVIETYRKPQLRVWKKDFIEFAPQKEKKSKGQETYEFSPKPLVSSQKLSELALIIDTGGAYTGEEEANKLHESFYEKQKTGRQ